MNTTYKYLMVLCLSTLLMGADSYLIPVTNQNGAVNVGGRLAVQEGSGGYGLLYSSQTMRFDVGQTYDATTIRSGAGGPTVDIPAIYDHRNWDSDDADYGWYKTPFVMEAGRDELVAQWHTQKAIDITSGATSTVDFSDPWYNGGAYQTLSVGTDIYDVFLETGNGTGGDAYYVVHAPDYFSGGEFYSASSWTTSGVTLYNAPGHGTDKSFQVVKFTGSTPSLTPNYTTTSSIYGTFDFTSNYTVGSTETLTILSGSTLNFASGKRLIVYGTLSAVGTSGNKITFTRSGSSGSWLGILYHSGSDGDLQHANISHASYGVYCYYSSPDIRDNTFTNNTYGIYMNHSNSIIDGNTLTSDKLSMYSSNPTMDNNVISGKVYLNNSDPNMYNNLLTQEFIQLYASNPYLYKNTIVGSGIFALWAENNSSPQLGGAGSQRGYNRLGPVDDIVTIYAINHSQPFLGTGAASGYTDGGYNTVLAEHASLASTDGTSEIKADYTWWGTASPSPGLFSGNVDHLAPLPSDPGGGYVPKAIGSGQLALSPSEPTVKDTSSAAWLWNHGKHLWHKHGSAKALGIFKRLIADYSSTPEAHYALTKLAKINFSRKDVGFAPYLHGLQQMALDSDLQAAIMDVLAIEHLRRNDIATAKSISEQTLKQYPDTEHEFTGLFNLFNIYYHDLNDAEGAQSILTQLKTKYPDRSLTLWAQEEMGEEVNWNALGKSTVSEGIVQVQEQIPAEYYLGSNYPNPFNPMTSIKFGLPTESMVRLTVYDIMGREVITLVDEYRPEGTHQVMWDSKDKSGGKVASGIYIYTIKTDHFIRARKMVLLK